MKQGIKHSVKEIIKQNDIGTCVICGKNGKLTKEHIPPRCAFNKNTIRVSSMTDMMTANLLPWEGGKVENAIIQGGFSLKSLCKECNEQTGALYGRAYKSFIKCISDAMESVTLQPNQECHIRNAKFKPLNVFKQIVSMFNSLNPGCFKSKKIDMKEFLLNKDVNKFCRNVHFYMFLTRDSVSAPIMGKCSSVNGKLYTFISSEVSHYPIGIIMALNHELENELCINSFLDFKYDEEINADFTISYHERNLPIVGDFRTKEQISACNQCNRTKRQVTNGG